MTMRVMLGYPVSANLYWRHFKGRTVRSARANEYRAETKKKIDSSYVGAMAKGTCEVRLVLHPRITKKGAASLTVMDLDNCIKVTLDALQGLAYENDRQVRRIVAEYGPPKAGGGLTVEIMEAA